MGFDFDLWKALTLGQRPPFRVVPYGWGVHKDTHAGSYERAVEVADKLFQRYPELPYVVIKDSLQMAKTVLIRDWFGVRHTVDFSNLADAKKPRDPRFIAAFRTKGYMCPLAYIVSENREQAVAEAKTILQQEERFGDCSVVPATICMENSIWGVNSTTDWLIRKEGEIVHHDMVVETLQHERKRLQDRLGEIDQELAG